MDGSANTRRHSGKLRSRLNSSRENKAGVRTAIRAASSTMLILEFAATDIQNSNVFFVSKLLSNN